MSAALPLNDGSRPRRPFEAQRIDVGKLFEKLPPHAIEAEMALLGSLILDYKVCGEVIPIIRDETHFYKPAHQAIYKAAIDLYNTQNMIDLVPLKQKLADENLLEQIGGVDYLIQLAESVPSATSAAHYARLVRDKAILRQLIDASGRILYDSYHTALPVDELLNQAEQEIFRIAEAQGTADEAVHLKKLLDEIYEKLETATGQAVTGMDTGFTDLNEMTSGLQNGEMIIVAARPSMGKAQPLDAKVLTSSGWTTMGQLKIGDALASVDGQPSRVTGIFPQGMRQVYRLTFADGRAAQACAEHLWCVHYREWPQPRILDTHKLITLLQRKRYHNRLWIETFTGEFGGEHDLPLDPWLLGCLIGDGSLSGTSVRFSTAEQQLLEKVQVAAGDAYEITHAGQYDYRIKQRGGAHPAGLSGVRTNPIKAALESLGLWNCDAFTKFIPKVYLNASKANRRRLLEGLIDTDGWVEKWGSLRISTASLQLAQDVVELVRSLGGTASFTLKHPRYRYRGRPLQGQPAYICNLQLPDADELWLLHHKRERLQAGRQRQRRLNLISIEPVGVVETQCIAVSHPRHLYITDEYVVTHNTAFAVNMAEHMAANLKQPVAIFSLEMSRQQLAQRILSSRSGVDGERIRRMNLQEQDYQRLALTVGELADAPLYIDDTPGLTLLQLRAKARRLVERQKIRAIFIDYLQLMSEPGAESRQQEVSNLSRGIKAMARELSLPVVCLSQLNRSPEAREGHRPRMSDLRESGSIEQDADVVLMLHREEYFHDEEWKNDPENADKLGVAEVIITKQRNGPVGTVKLHFNGSTTRFHDLARSHGNSRE